MSISKTIMNAVDKMDLSTLSQLQALINERKQDIANAVRNTLNVGDEVKVNHKKLAGWKCTITAIKQKQVTVKASYGMSYNVPLTTIVPIN
jgi:transcription antitermination factor NusG